MNRTTLFFLFFLFPNLGFTQTHRVQAKVIDATTKKQIPYSTIIAYNKADSSYIAGGLTDSLGFFELKFKAQNYILEVSHIGYQKTFIFAEATNEINRLNDIALISQTLNIGDIVIAGQSLPISHHVNKTVYKVSDMLNSNSRTISELLKSLPSITQDFNGASLINGVPALFYIDGRELSSSELDTYSPSQIESIEVISNPTSKYDADGLSGIIQLRSKKTRELGLNGEINISGTHDTQLGALSFMYNNNKFSLSSNFSIHNNYQHGSIETITDNYYSLSEIKSDILNILSGISSEYRFSKQSTLNLSYQYTDFGYTAHDYSQAREGVTAMRGLTHQLTLSHNYTFGTNGEKLSTSINYNHTAPETESDLDYFTYIYTTYNRNKNSSLIANIDYTLPFTSQATFEAGMKSHNRNINIYREEDFAGTTISDEYKMSESILAVYMLMNSRMNRINFQFGIRGESDLLSKDENARSWNLFPHLSLEYSDNNRNIFKIGYNSRISRPTAADLNPFLMLIDPTSQFQGEPDLKPEYSHNIYADYIIRSNDNQIKISTYYRFVKNLITKEYTNISEGMVLYKPINISLSHFYGANAVATIKLNNRLTVIPNLGIDFVELPSNYASEIRSVSTLNAGANLQIQLPEDINIGALVSYSSGAFSAGLDSQSAIVQGLAIGLPLLYSELSASKGFLNNKLNVTFRVTDPLNVQRNGFLVYSDNTERESLYLMQTRFIHLGVTYKINKQKTIR